MGEFLLPTRASRGGYGDRPLGYSPDRPALGIEELRFRNDPSADIPVVEEDAIDPDKKINQLELEWRTRDKSP